MPAYLLDNSHSRIHPKKFGLWIFFATIVMMFAGLTSAFIVRRAAGNWIEYKLPDIFWISTAVIVLSSIFLQLAYFFRKKENLANYRVALALTLAMGLSFVILQYEGWRQLTDIGIRLQGNPSGSFLYVISGIHALHVLGGVVFLFIFFVKSLWRKNPVKELMDEINPNKLLGTNLLVSYWHFVGLLWIYLFVFFLFNSL